MAFVRASKGDCAEAVCKVLRESGMFNSMYCGRKSRIGTPDVKAHLFV